MNRHGENDPMRHAEKALELEELLAMVAGRCVNEGARKELLALHPVTDPDWIAGRLGEIEEARKMMSEGEDPPIPDTSALGSIGRALSERRNLGTGELLALSRLEREVENLARFFEKSKGRFPRLGALASALESHRELTEAVEKAIDPDGGIRDDASPSLGKLRRRIRRLRDEIRSRAQVMAARYGENSYATVIDGRFELLVPRSLYRRGTGILHGTSQSGESVYFEPAELVERNNELEVLIEDETREQARILAELTRVAGRCFDGIARNVHLVEKIDAIRAKALFADEFGCISPVRSDGKRLRLVGARHPLLVESLRGPRVRGAARDEAVVPLDVEIAPEEPVLVITGPNAGGKTVALKTIGLAAMMHQCGLQVPCKEGTELPVFSGFFADIGDEQSISSSLSTFTSHLGHLDAMLRTAGETSLCLVDEIGDGTDPEEGAALANAVLDALLEAGAMAVVTTHYGKVKVHAMETEGICNGSMLFDDRSGRPLYRLVQGMAGRSRGMETARRFGLPERVMRRAEEYLGEESRRLERLLEELESSRMALEKERSELRKQSEELGRVMALYVEREERLKRLEREHDEKARREAGEMLARARKEVERIVKEIRESGAGREEVKRAHEKLRRLLEEAGVDAKRSAKREAPAGIGPGSRVALNPSGAPSGIVLEVENGVATVEMGGKRIKIDIKKLHLSREGEGERTQATGYDVEFQPLDSSTLDVRGRDREDAMEEVDRFLDLAILNGLKEVRVVHGVGEGILMSALRERLAGDPRVASWRPGRSFEGGEGVSIVVLH